MSAQRLVGVLNAGRTPAQRLFGLTPLTVRFQPMVRLLARRWCVHAYEAVVSVTPDATLHAIGPQLRDAIQQPDAQIEIDRCSAHAALTAADGLATGAGIGLKVHAATLECDAGFGDFLAATMERAGQRPHRLMVEVVEYVGHMGDAFIRALDALREMRMEVVLDDVVPGRACYDALVACRPDALKIEPHLVIGVCSDEHRQAALRILARAAEQFGVYVIANGVEHEDDFGVLLAAGVRAMQGSLIAPPAPAPEAGRWFANNVPAPNGRPAAGRPTNAAGSVT